MVRNYRPKIGGMPHARLDSGFYLTVFRHHVFAQPPTAIVQYTRKPGPTVRRTLDRLRLAMVNCAPLSDYVRKMAEFVELPNMGLYEDIYTGISKSYFESNRTSLEAVDSCLRACPLGMKPPEFKREFLAYAGIVFESFSFVVPNATDYQRYTQYLGGMMKCRFCKLKRLRNAFRGTFASAPQIYLDYMHYFSSRRIVSPSRNELLQLHIDATNVSLFGDIYMTYYTREHGRSGSFDQAEKALLEFFLGTTAGMFELIESLDVEELQFA